MSDTVAVSYTFVAITCPPASKKSLRCSGLADGSWGLGSSIVNLVNGPTAVLLYCTSPFINHALTFFNGVGRCWISMTRV